eukprot:g4835.t1
MKRTAPSTPAKAATATSATSPSGPSLSGMKIKKRKKKGTADATITVLALVGGEMHATVFTTADLRTAAVQSIITAGTHGYSPFMKKVVRSFVSIPGTTTMVPNSNGYCNVYHIDMDALEKVEDEITDEDADTADLLNLVKDKYLGAFGDVTVHMAAVPLSRVLPKNSFAKWYKQQLKVNPDTDISDNKAFHWVPTTASSSDDAATAKAYLEGGMEMNTAYRQNLDSSSQEA